MKYNKLIEKSNEHDKNSQNESMTLKNLQHKIEQLES